jgi:polar amino acid transport system permease protein
MTAISFNANHLGFLLQGAAWTAVLSLIAIVGGGLFAFVVALARVSPHRAVRLGSGAWVQLVQGSPLLVIMFLTYFGLPTLGFKVSALAAAGASLIVYVSAYLGEIWRSAIEAVPKPQWEAAECLALTRTQRMFKVVLPQAVRLATPSTVGFMVQIIKNTSLASVVGFVELARSGQIINNSIFEPFIVYMIIAGLYFLLCYPLSVWSRRLERQATTSTRTAKTAALHEPVLHAS